MRGLGIGHQIQSQTAMTFQWKVSASDESPSCTKLNNEFKRSKWRQRADHTFSWCLEVKSINYGRNRARTKNKIPLFHSKWKTWAFVTAAGSWKRRSMHFFYILQNHRTTGSPATSLVEWNSFNIKPKSSSFSHSAFLQDISVSFSIILPRPKSWNPPSLRLFRQPQVIFAVPLPAGSLQCACAVGFGRGPCPPLW